MALFDASLGQQRLNAGGSGSRLGLQDRRDLPDGTLPGSGGELLFDGHGQMLSDSSSTFNHNPRMFHVLLKPIGRAPRIGAINLALVSASMAIKGGPNAG